MQRIRFGGNLGVCSIRDAQQPLCTAASRSGAGKCCVTESSARVLMLWSLNYRLRDAVSMGGRRRKGGASVSGAGGVHEASETLSSSFTLRHRARMQDSCVAESCVNVGAAAAKYRLRDSVSTHVSPGNGGASDSAAHGAHEASETPSSSLALRHNDQVQAMLCRREQHWC